MKKYDPLKEPSSEEWLSLNEQERINLAVDYHRRAQVRLPNVKVHAIVHVIVENQIALGDEIPVGATVRRLMSEGLDRHDAIHAVGSVLMKNLYELLSHRETAPNVGINASYVAALQRLTAEHWLHSGLPEDGATTGTLFAPEEPATDEAVDVDDEFGVDDVDRPSATARRKPVSWNELLDAHELADFGEPGSHSTFLNRKSGEFFLSFGDVSRRGRGTAGGY
jgi:hypothetical protein